MLKLTADQRAAIEARIQELTQALDHYVEEANRTIANSNGRIAELRRLLAESQETNDDDM